MSNRISPEIIRRRKTPEQQAAWNELLLLISDPEWYQNSEKCKRHKTLMGIIEYREPVVMSDDEKYQRYLDNRPGLEVTVVKMLLEKKQSKEIRDELKMDFKVIAFCRRKYNLNPKIRTKKLGEQHGRTNTDDRNVVERARNR